MSDKLIAHFIKDYADRALERGETPIPADTLQSILEEFVILEAVGWNEPDRLSEALKALRSLLEKDEKATALLALISKEVANVRRKLERQKEANMLLFERRVMQSHHASKSPG